MILDGNTLKRVLEKLNIRMQKHNFNVTFTDIENGVLNSKRLTAYPFQYDRACFRGNRKEIEQTVENIFNGTNIDLLQDNKLYKKYGFNIKENNESCDQYEFNSFESFELSSNREYKRTKIKFTNDKTEVYETKGKVDDFNNYVTNNIYRITIKNNSISIKDETNPRLENNETKLVKTSWLINNEREYYLSDDINNIDNYAEIINDSNTLKAILETLYPNLYTLYINKLNTNKTYKK